MKKIAILLLVLSILTGNVSQMSSYASGATKGGVLTENKPALETGDLISSVSKETKDAVGEILSSMTVTQDTYSKNMRGKYIVSLKDN